MNTEHATPELFAALAKGQLEIENATKNAKNPHFRSNYADLAEVLNTARPVLAKHGIAILQSYGFDGSMVEVTTMLAHSGGGYVTSKSACVPAKSDAQGIGTATTYMRRYSLAAMCGIAQEDDDGNSAAHNEPAKAVHADWLAKIAEIGDEIEGQKMRDELKESFAGQPPKVLISAWQAAMKKVAA